MTNTPQHSTNPEQPKPTFKEWLKNLGTLNIIGIVLCILLIPVLIFNCILLIKGIAKPDQVPSIGKNVPLIVITESMEPDILAGDIIICHKVDPQTLKEGDVIAFFDPASTGSAVVTHKIEKVIYADDGVTIKEFKTYGINNLNADGSFDVDKRPVPVENVVGIWEGDRIPVIGHIALFMQSVWGLIICVFLPLACFVTYELLQRRKLDQGKAEDMAKLKAELEALRASQAQQQPSDNTKDNDNNNPSV